MLTPEEKTDLGRYVQGACGALGKYFRERNIHFKETLERERIDPLIEIFRDGYTPQVQEDPKSLTGCLFSPFYFLRRLFQSKEPACKPEKKESYYDVSPFIQVFPQYQFEKKEELNRPAVEHIVWLLSSAVLKGTNRRVQFRLKLEEEVLKND